MPNADAMIDAMDAAYNSGVEDLAAKALELLQQLTEEEDLEPEDVLQRLTWFFEDELAAELIDEDYDETADLELASAA